MVRGAVQQGDRLTITTPEGVQLDLTLANVGSRFIAQCFDIVIELLIAFAGAVLIALLLDGGVAVLFYSVGAFLILFGYDVAFEVWAGGRTPGKRWTGLRVLQESGAPVTFVPSAIRNVLRLIDFLPVAYGIGVTAIFFTDHNQRLGDLAASTIVVRERHGGRQPSTTLAVPDPSVPGTGRLAWDISAVTPQDLAMVQSFLERRATLTPGARAHLAQTLADRLRAKIAGAPPLEHEAFLERLAAERER